MINQFVKILNSIQWEDVLKKIENRSIILWGASEAGEIVHDFLKNRGIFVECFIDSDKSKIGSKFNSLLVYSSEILNDLSEKYYIFVCASYHKELEEILNFKGYTEMEDYFYFFHKPIEVKSFNNYCDIYGNKINGCSKECTIIFDGYNSEINIGDGIILKSTIIKSSNSKINIKSNCILGRDNMLPKFSMEIDNILIKGAIPSKSDILNDYIVDKNVHIIVTSSEVTIGNNCILDKGVCITAISSKINISDDCVLDKDVCVTGILSEIIINRNCHIKEISVLLCEYNSLLSIGNNFEADKRSSICAANYSKIFIGNNTNVRNELVIAAMNFSTIKIGDDCMFSYSVSLQCDDAHQIYNSNKICVNDNNKFILIGNHVWIGLRSILLHGTKIGDGSIVGAGSVLKGEFPNNCTIAGVPAKVLKSNVSWKR